MRKAEIVMAMLMAAFSLYLMGKSSELPIGWIPDEGPGGGAFPFWLAAIMFLSCLAIIFQWVARLSPQSQSTEPFIDRRALKVVGLVAGTLTAMIGLIHVIGVYFAVPLFITFYMRVLGRHGWMQTAMVSVFSTVFLFFFFDIALRITLPKGYSEPLFLPLYDYFYKIF